MSSLTLTAALIGAMLSASPEQKTSSDPAILAKRIVRIDPAHSVLSFSVKHFGFTRVRGQFREWGSHILWDPEDVTRSSFTVVAKTGTVDTGLERRDNDLKSGHFFDVEKYPVIIFQSTRIEKQGGGFVAYGNLTVRDITKEVAMPFQFLGTREFGDGIGRIFASGSLRISREEFGLTNALDRVARSLSVVSDEVEFEIEIQGAAIQPEVLPYSSAEKPSIGEKLAEVVEKGDGYAAAKKFKELKEADPEAYDFGAGELMKLSHRLRAGGRADDAVVLAHLAIEVSEEPSRNAYFTLAMAYLAQGQQDKAVEQCKRILELVDAHDTLALEALRHLERA